jgi:CspA family cold shock protein
MSDLRKGTIATWSGERGFGFIKPDDGDCRNIFVHISSLGYTEPPVGTRVEYRDSMDRLGRPCAIDVVRLVTK